MIKILENECWINSIDPYGFNGILDFCQVEDLQMINDKMLHGKEL